MNSLLMDMFVYLTIETYKIIKVHKPKKKTLKNNYYTFSNVHVDQIILTYG